MPYKRRVLTRNYLLWGFFFLFIAIFFGETIREQISFQYKKIKTYTDNFYAIRNPQVTRRLRPPHPVSQEIKLASSFGEPFVSFTPEKWNEFWSMIYGLYPLGEPQEPGLPNTMRQLSEEELRLELVERYQKPFVNFKDRHWKSFFSIVFD